ncbi:MAG: beta-eliminating lyase-related protein, partial [Draconibacterium sp.]|nr:beta-eliminating lyase-related protein [Draconibacterium sp.]
MTNQNSTTIKFYSGEEIPVELHKVRIVQKLFLKPIEERYDAIEEAGYNTFGLNTKDVFLDQLTDSGTNAMSDNQVSSMLQADDAYAGSQSFYRMEKAAQEVFGKKYVLPAHQGRAAENIISQVFIKKGQVIPMNYHFTTTKEHMEINGGKVLEIYTDDALKIKSDVQFKGNIDIDQLKAVFEEYGSEGVAFVRMEASTNLIGGQPFSMQNMRDVRALCDQY